MVYGIDPRNVHLQSFQHYFSYLSIKAVQIGVKYFPFTGSILVWHSKVPKGVCSRGWELRAYNALPASPSRLDGSTKFRKFKMVDGRHFENGFIAISQPGIIRFHFNTIWCAFCFPFSIRLDTFCCSYPSDFSCLRLWCHLRFWEVKMAQLLISWSHVTYSRPCSSVLRPVSASIFFEDTCIKTTA